MQLLLTTLCVFTLVVQPIFYKIYNQKCFKGQVTFSMIVSFFALLFFVFTTKDISINVKIIPYSVLFAVCYGAAILWNVLALKAGSLAITSLVISYSLIIPTLYGLVFLNEKSGILQYIGIFALLISLFLVRAKPEENTEKKKITFLWVIYLVIGFITNGMCSVVQNAQSKKFAGMQNGNFMVLALGICVLFLFVYAIIFERKEIVPSLKKGMFLGAATGICNATTNLLVMLSMAIVPASIFFPVLSAGQIVLTYIVAVVFYKEKFISRQNIGIIFGIIALIFLNI